MNHPQHYTKGGVECIDAIRASMTQEAFAGYCKGNIMKYIFRYEDKGGSEDLEKAAVYLDWLIDAVKGEDKKKREAYENIREKFAEWVKTYNEARIKADGDG